MAVRKTKKGAALKRWFKEDWKDVKTGKPCGRKEGEKRSTPYCRPTKRVSSKTPKTSGEMTASEKRSKVRQKNKLTACWQATSRVSSQTEKDKEVMKKAIPAGKKGAGMRALKKSAPEVASRMGYKYGGKVGYRNGGAVMAGKKPKQCSMS